MLLRKKAGNIQQEILPQKCIYVGRIEIYYFSVCHFHSNICIRFQSYDVNHNFGKKHFLPDMVLKWELFKVINHTFLVKGMFMT